MKKRLLSVAAVAMSVMTAMAQLSPTATTKVYDLDKFGDGVIDVFYTADKAGLKFPTQEMWEAAGFDMATINFVRTHVAKKDLLERSGRLDQSTTERRNLFMNLPIGIGKEQGGYPSANFSDDTFSAWNYTNMFGSWNHGLFHASAVVGDAGHKNGTDVLAGIKFFESWTAGSGASGWVAKVQEKDPQGYEGFAYVRPLVNACIYFGKDGINYNFEDTGYDNCKEFHRACYKYAEECGMKDFHVALYTAASSLTASNTATLLGTKEDGQCYDTFLNYASGNFAGAYNIRSSVTNAENIFGSCEDVYQGAWIVSMARSWSNLNANDINKRMGICLWGEHSQSRFMSFNQGMDGLTFQENYQRLMDRFMSGGYRNPASRPAENNDADWNDGLAGFQGIAHYIAERSVINQNLPFTTYFSTGNGDRYNYKGKKTLGSWYNLGQQDVVPTYRWLVYEAGTTTPVLDKGNRDDLTKNEGVPFFTNRDSYIGGSALKFANTQAIDVILYYCNLKVGASNPKATMAFKSPADKAAFKVIVRLKGETQYKEVATFDAVKAGSWNEQTVDLALNEGDVIEYLGLRTTGDTKDVMVGMLSLTDDATVVPNELEDAVVEVVEECHKSLSAKLTWNVKGETDQWGMLTNEAANIDHFQILYKDGENGNAYEVGRTSSWAAYVGNLPMTETTEPWVGVRACATDGKTYTKVQWVKVTRADASILPEALSANGNYPSCILDNASDGLENALNQRYIEKFAVTGADAAYEYTNTIGTPYMKDIAAGISDKNADKTNYILADQTLNVTQGQTLTCTLTIANFGDGLQWCTAKGYADWDCSEGFNPYNDEDIWTSGTSNQKKINDDFGQTGKEVTFTVKVPEDAVPGNSRIRLVFSDAWFPHPGAAGATSKGFTMDIPVVISGTNPGREAETDTHDQGVATPVIYGTESGIGNIGAGDDGVSSAEVKNGEVVFTNVEKAWVYDASGRMVAFAGNGENVSLAGQHGAFVIRMRNGNVIRSIKVIL